MTRRWGALWTALFVLACGAWQWLVHSAVADRQSESIRVALITLPVLALACWIAARSRHKLLWTLVLAAAAGAIFLLEHQEHLGLAAAYGIPHAAAYVFLLVFFGRTLRRGREPLVARLARRVHGTLPPAMAAYTRRVTIAWCVFFAAQLAASALLFLFSSLDRWSLVVNVLNFPLVAAMFVAEYAYRVARHRDFPHASFLESIRAFAADGASSKQAEAR